MSVVRTPTSWDPTDPHLHGAEVARIVGDSVFVSSSETAIYKYFVRHKLSVKCCNELLAIVKHASFDPLSVRFKAVESWHSRMAKMNEFGIQYVNLRDASIDGSQDAHFYYRPAWLMVQEMAASAQLAAHFLQGYQPCFDDESGERQYGEFVSAGWMEEATLAVADKDITVLAVFMGSDATKITNRESAHPFYMSLGNFRNAFRRTR